MAPDTFQVIAVDGALLATANSRREAEKVATAYARIGTLATVRF